MISPGATNPELTQRGYQHIMRTAGLDSSQGPTAAKYILETVKPSASPIIHDKQQYGEGLARSVQDGLKAANANVVFLTVLPPGERFLHADVRLKKKNIDFVYYGGYYPEMGQMLRQARSVGLKTQFMGPEGVGMRRCRTLPVMPPKACWSLCQNAMTRIRQTRASLMR